MWKAKITQMEVREDSLRFFKIFQPLYVSNPWKLRVA